MDACTVLAHLNPHFTRGLVDYVNAIPRELKATVSKIAVLGRK